MKKQGFTLVEILITLTIIGFLLTLIVPGLIKSTSQDTYMITLKSMVSDINNVLNPELTKNGAKTLSGTTLIDEPEKFLHKFNYNDENGKIEPFGNGYDSYSGSTALDQVDTDASVIMANGAGVGIKLTKRNGTNEDEAIIYIDVNASKKPNIVGVDLYALRVIGINDFENSTHVGDLRSALESNTEEGVNSALSKCKNGEVDYCYQAVEESGFNPKYLD